SGPARRNGPRGAGHPPCPGAAGPPRSALPRITPIGDAPPPPTSPCVPCTTPVVVVATWAGGDKNVCPRGGFPVLGEVLPADSTGKGGLILKSDPGDLSAALKTSWRVA